MVEKRIGKRRIVRSMDIPHDLSRKDHAMKTMIARGARAAQEVMALGGVTGMKEYIATTMSDITMIGNTINGRAITTMNGRFTRSDLYIRGEPVPDIEG